MDDSEATEQASITTMKHLENAFERAMAALRQLITEDHLRGETFDTVSHRSDGQPYLGAKPVDGPDSYFVLGGVNGEGGFFIVHNERGRPGGAGGYHSADRVLRWAVQPVIDKLAFNFAYCQWHRTTGQGPESLTYGLTWKQEREFKSEFAGHSIEDEVERLLVVLD